MSRLSAPSLNALADFTGTDEDTFGEFAETALAQATILLELATGLTEYPEAGTVEWDLANNGILEMANALYLGQPFQNVRATPFQSETIGSYSYSKASGQVAAGLPTGLVWFDMAAQRLGGDGYSVIDPVSVSVFENDNILIDAEGNQKLVLPEENLPWPWAGGFIYPNNQRGDEL